MSNLFNPPKFVDLDLVGLDGNALVYWVHSNVQQEDKVGIVKILKKY